MSVLIAGAALLALASFVHAEAAQARTCENSIVACGCTIKKAGTYTVAGPLSDHQGLTRKGDCIDVSAANVVLLLDGNDIAGPGSGSAIRVLPSAANATVIGSSFTGTNATISDWDIAVYVQGSRFFGNGMTAAINKTAGFLLYKSGNSIIDGVEAGLNGIGVEIRGGRGNQISDFSAFGNVTFGVWITNSGDNTIQNGDLEDNINSGIYLGCSESGPGGAKCSGTAVKHNRIFNNLLDDNTAYGIALDQNAPGTVVAENVAYDSGTNDLFDRRSECDKNLWRQNDFVTRNQLCIQ